MYDLSAGSLFPFWLFRDMYPLHLDGWLIPHNINLRKSEPQLWRVLVCWWGRREGMSAPPTCSQLLGSSTTPRMLPVPATVPPGQREPQERGKWLREHIPLAWSQVVFLNCKAAQYRDKTVKQAQPKNNSARFKNSSTLKDSIPFVISPLDSKPQSQKGHEFVPNNMNHTPWWAPKPLPGTGPEEKRNRMHWGRESTRLVIRGPGFPPALSPLR